MQILRSTEPRLAVVKGLVMDRRQKLISGVATLKTRMYLSLSEVFDRGC